MVELPPSDKSLHKKQVLDNVCAHAFYVAKHASMCMEQRVLQQNALQLSSIELGRDKVSYIPVTRPSVQMMPGQEHVSSELLQPN